MSKYRTQASGHNAIGLMPLLDGVIIFAVSFCFTALVDAYVDSLFRAIATGKGLIQTIVLLYLFIFSTYGALIYQNHVRKKKLIFILGNYTSN